MANPSADREMGAVLIAVNSYWNADEKYRLPYTDRVLKGYIETFYRHLFFHVHVVVDFTRTEFYDKLDEFSAWCRKHEMIRIAVVLYGHGGIYDRKECVLTHNFETLELPELEEKLHREFPKNNKYLFIDACRKPVQEDQENHKSDSVPKNIHEPYVFLANTAFTTLIRSTLLFKVAISNAWSECFAMKLRNHGTLLAVVNTVDDDMREKYTDDIRRKCNIPVNEGYQKSEMRLQGVADEPNFRGEANANNPDRGIRKLPPCLQKCIEVAEQFFVALRTELNLPSNPPVTFLDCPPDNPSNQPAPGPIIGGLPIPQANLPLPNQPVAVLGSLLDSPSKQPSAQGTQPSSTSSTQAMAGVTSTSTGSKMDEEIGNSANIVGVDEYRKRLIGEMAMLGTVLGIGEDADAILNKSGTIDTQLIAILKCYFSHCKEIPPTWRDFCTALKKYNGFNALRSKIEADHK